MSDREAAGFRGPVKKVITDRVHSLGTQISEIEFDAKGQVLHPKLPPELPAGQDIFWGGLPGLHGYAFPTRGASTVEMRLSPRGVLIEAVFRMQDQSVATRIVTALDPVTGHIVEAMQYSGDKPLIALSQEEMDRVPLEQRERFAALFHCNGLESRIVFSYGAGGKLIAVETYIGLQRINRSQFSYNDRGDRVKESREAHSDLIFEYEYDEHGNWIRMIAKSDEGESETRRRITYY